MSSLCNYHIFIYNLHICVWYIRFVCLYTYLAVNIFKLCSFNDSATVIIFRQSTIGGYVFSSINGLFDCAYAVLTYTRAFNR